MIELTDEQSTYFNELTKLEQNIALAVISGECKNDVDIYRKSGGKSNSKNSAASIVSKAKKKPAFRNFVASVSVTVQKKIDAAISSSIATKEMALERLSEIALYSESEASSIQSIAQLKDIQGWKAVEKIETLNKTERTSFDYEEYLEIERLLDERLR